jgi:hypothetical protein
MLQRVFVLDMIKIMRAVIISELDGIFKKLAGVKEGSGGIYFGFCGKAQDMHYSYHQDGRMPIKKCSKYLTLPKLSVINEITRFICLPTYGVTLEKGYEFVMGDYSNSKDSTAVVYINPEIIKGREY